jgi:hypothetical protein
MKRGQDGLKKAAAIGCRQDFVQKRKANNNLKQEKIKASSLS